MDEAELTRKAIAEIMRDMDAQREADKLPQLQERKKNPLGRPNKDFLDRTLNSVMTHNKRESDRNYRNCQRKLEAMDSANADGNRPSREKYRRTSLHRRTDRRKRRHSETSSKSSRTSESSSSSGKVKKHRKKKSKKIKKKKKHRKRDQSSSSSSTSSRISVTDSSENSDYHRKYKKHKEKDQHTTDGYAEETYNPPEDIAEHDTNVGFYVNPNMALAMAYNHMNQLMALQQQNSIQDLLKEELENEQDIDIPSDLSLNNYTTDEESELNVSLNSSSAEELNGILTFNVSSDEEINKKIRTPPVKTQRNKRKKENSSSELEESNDSDNGTVQSHISLVSDGSSMHEKTKEVVEVSILSSSSDSDCQEIPEIIATECVRTAVSEVKNVDVIEIKDLESEPLLNTSSVMATPEVSTEVNNCDPQNAKEHEMVKDKSVVIDIETKGDTSSEAKESMPNQINIYSETIKVNEMAIEHMSAEYEVGAVVVEVKEDSSFKADKNKPHVHDGDSEHGPDQNKETDMKIEIEQDVTSKANAMNSSLINASSVIATVAGDANSLKATDHESETTPVEVSRDISLKSNNVEDVPLQIKEYDSIKKQNDYLALECNKKREFDQAKDHQLHITTEFEATKDGNSVASEENDSTRLKDRILIYNKGHDTTEKHRDDIVESNDSSINIKNDQSLNTIEHTTVEDIVINTKVNAEDPIEQDTVKDDNLKIIDDSSVKINEPEEGKDNNFVHMNTHEISPDCNPSVPDEPANNVLVDLTND